MYSYSISRQILTTFLAFFLPGIFWHFWQTRILVLKNKQWQLPTTCSRQADIQEYGLKKLRDFENQSTWLTFWTLSLRHYKLAEGLVTQYPIHGNKLLLL